MIWGSTRCLECLFLLKTVHYCCCDMGNGWSIFIAMPMRFLITFIPLTIWFVQYLCIVLVVLLVGCKCFVGIIYFWLLIFPITDRLSHTTRCARYSHPCTYSLWLDLCQYLLTYKLQQVQWWRNQHLTTLFNIFFTH